MVIVIVVQAMAVVVVAAGVVVVTTGLMSVVGEGLVRGHLLSRLGLARPPDALPLLGVVLLESVVVAVVVGLTTSNGAAASADSGTTN